MEKFTLNILLLSSFSPFDELTGPIAAGAERAMRTISHQLAASGHNVHYLSFGTETLAPTQINGVTVHIFHREYARQEYPSSLQRRLSWCLDRLMISPQKKASQEGHKQSIRARIFEKLSSLLTPKHTKFKKLIAMTVQEHSIDLIHCFSSMPDSLAATSVGTRYGIPVVQRMGGRFWYLKYKKTDNTFDAARYLQDMRMVFKDTDCLAFNSQILKEETACMMAECHIPFLDSSPVLDIGVTLPDDIPPLDAKYRDLLEGKFFTLLVVGKFKKDSKRQDLLISAISRLPEHIDAHVFFAGSGVTLPAMEELARTLNVEERVHFLGNVPHQQVFSLLKAVDAFVHPTDFEGSSKAVAEAMLCGKAVIASNIAPLREHLSHRKTGLLADNTAESFAEEILQLCEDPCLRNDLEEAAQSYAQKHFLPEVNIHRYEELFWLQVQESSKFSKSLITNQA
jgi:glycosyltransferase involved in cell wall biosynthesis